MKQDCNLATNPIAKPAVFGNVTYIYMINRYQIRKKLIEITEFL